MPDAGLDAGAIGADVGPAADGGCWPARAPGQPSRCAASGDSVACDFRTTELLGRTVYFQAPIGSPPPAGWPVVVVFQGSFFGPGETIAGDRSLPFGGFHQVLLQALLLDLGFMVVAPEAQAGLAWATNFPFYESSDDHALMLILLDELRIGGVFGPIDPARRYATGISSGGYMTSRMAVSYAGEFRALAIHSGAYATCTNVLCSIPDPLPSDHPPTLFLHGDRDVTVPKYTAEAYRDQLDLQGIETTFVADEAAGHEWLAAAPEAIACWFLRR